MKLQTLSALGLFFFSSFAVAAPTVNGNTISWPDDGWYQVQQVNEDAPNNITVCEGGLSCEVAQGEYIVINHSTGVRFTDIQVTQVASAEKIIVNDNIISWPDDGWYQVLNSETFEQVCSGGSSCAVAPGTYIVINHTTGERFEDIYVNVVIEPIVVTGTTISWPDNGWYQVQDQDTLESVCNGGRECVVPPGNYIVINHSTGERFPNTRVVMALPVPGDIEFEEFIGGDIAFIPDQPRFQVIRSNEELTDLYFGFLVGPSCDVCTTREILSDFTTSTMVLVMHELVPTGGYDIMIEKAVFGQDRLTIEVLKTSPGDNCIVTEALTAPFKIYKLSNLFDDIDIVERTVQGAACE